MIKFFYRKTCHVAKFRKLNNVNGFYYLIFCYNSNPNGWQNNWLKLTSDYEKFFFHQIFDMEIKEFNKHLEENFSGKYIMDKLCFHKDDLKSVEEWIESVIIMNKLVE